MRSNYNGELTSKNVNQKVHLFGWANKARNLGGVIFIDLRDVSGIVQIVVKPESPLYSIAEQVHNEYVLEIEGEVVLRENPNPNIKTGEVEVIPDTLKILSKSDPLPIDAKSNDEIRLKYRFLDLRREDLQNTIKLRATILKSVRNYLEENRFIEIETPILARSTPEGARDYLVPSRIFKGQFYALPQSPQLYKQLLMVAGFDRYYQIAKCFRDEDLRSDRQPEFNQIDIETSFLNQDEILTILEGMFKRIWKEALHIDIQTPFPRYEWDDCIRDYGSDKPDTRFDLKLVHLDDLFKTIDSPLFTNKHVVGIKINDPLDHFSRKKIEELTELIKKHNGENLLYVKMNGNKVSGSIVKLLNEEIVKSLNMEEGDIYLMTTGVDYEKTSVAMGSIRSALGASLNLIDNDVYDFKWVVNFPLFELSDDGSITSTHHPFTRPLEKDIPKILTDPLHCYSSTYDIVCHGYECGGGSLRIFDLDVQEKIFDVLGITPEEQVNKFGYLLDAMRYGCPPHGGCAFGVERMLMVIRHDDNIRDVVAFPKTNSAQDLMVDCPNEVDLGQLIDLGIKRM